MHCYYCGSPDATQPLKISDSFTAGNAVKSPHSTVMCGTCEGIMFGAIQKVWYFNPNKNGGAWTELYLRGITQLWQGDDLVAPKLLEPQEHTMVSAAGKVGKPKTLRAIDMMPTRVQMRDWLLTPPEPPFKICIAESGQKHILFLAQVGLRKDYFPVQFETDTLWLNHAHFKHLLEVFEALLALSFSKAEIMSGVYRNDRLSACYDQWTALEPAIAAERVCGRPSRLLQLLNHVAQRPEVEVVEEVAIEPEPVAAKLAEPDLRTSKTGQILLF